MNSAESERICCVLVNAEDQYSIWPASKPLPEGWAAAGFTGPKPDCVAYVDTVWTDMRPKSHRRNEGAA